jgi:pyruvate dehydrogenase E2 component (dihydrolipoamide acetyltransferase)
MGVRDFLLPDLGEGLEDAEVVGWKVAEGDRVQLNQTLVEVNTAKALVEIPAPWEGIVEKLHAAEGDLVKVGQPLVSIRVEDAADEPAGEPAPGREETTGGIASPKRRAVLVGYGVAEDEDGLGSPRQARQGEAEGSPRSGPVPASPPVRRLAKELGVDLATVEATGTGGRVTREDVMNAARGGTAPVTASGPQLEDAEVIPVRGTRRLIAEKMTRSVREIPHVTTFLTVDAMHVMAFREELSSEGERVGPLPIVVAALARVCNDHRLLNASFDTQRSAILVHRRCHVGIATDTDRGLMVPVIRDTDEKGLFALAREIARLSEGARAGNLEPAELVGSTITVTNVGTFGAEFGTPIINHPESAILALGLIEPRAIVVGGRVRARPAATLSLSFDHRVMDGAEAGRSLRALGDILESPFRLGALPR